MTTPAVDPAVPPVDPEEALVVPGPADPECGAFFVNLFSTVYPLVN